MDGEPRLKMEHARGRFARVVVIYLGVSWLLIQVANTLEDALELPGWVDWAVTVGLVIGFPVAIVYAWFRKEPVEANADSAAERMPSGDQVSIGSGLRPSVAVLPFVNLSDDNEKEYFADGMTEDIIMGLTAGRHIAVKSRSSTFAYKGQSVDIRDVAEQLGVAYVVEGTVRSLGDRLRITVQLLGAERGDHLWAEKFDREASEIFEIQDEVIASITSAVGATLARTESQRAARVQPHSLSAWQAVQRGSFYRGASGNSESETNGSIEELRAATQSEPDYAYAHSMLAWMLHYRAINGLTDDPAADIDEAREHLTRGLSLAPDDPFNLNICGGAFTYIGEAARAEELCDRALAIDPNYADVYFNLGMIYVLLGRLEEARVAFDTVERMAPEGPISRYYEWYRSHIPMHMGDYAAAEALVRIAIDKAPAYTTPYLHLIIILVELGRTDEAKEVAGRVLAINPHLKNRRVIVLEAGVVDSDAAGRGMALVRE